MHIKSVCLNSASLSKARQLAAAGSKQQTAASKHPQKESTTSTSRLPGADSKREGAAPVLPPLDSLLPPVLWKQRQQQQQQQHSRRGGSSSSRRCHHNRCCPRPLQLPSLLLLWCLQHYALSNSVMRASVSQWWKPWRDRTCHAHRRRGRPVFSTLSQRHCGQILA